jgi:dienelactone hydrolase
MRQTLRFPGRLLPLLALAVVLLRPGDGRAQKPPPPVQPNPQAPVLALTGPAGMQRGTTLELTLTGTNLAGPTGLYTSFPAHVTIPTDDENGQDNTKLRVRLEVPAEAPLGFYAIRLATTRGMSNLRIFCIDDLPQLLGVNTNRNKATPQNVPTPCVVAGRLDAETSAYYTVSAKAGQRLTFEVLGRRLGSAIDPQLSLYDAKTRRELAHDNDAPGLQTDPRLTFTFKEEGDYVLQLKDVLNRGGPDYWYRLRIGDFPCATVPVPMAAQRGTKVQVGFAGPAVAGVASVAVQVPTDPVTDTVWLAPRGPSGPHGWPVALVVSDHPELVEQEPNHEPARANRVPVPGGITGRFEKSNELDYYVFAGKKGQTLLVDAHTLEHHSPTLVYLVLKDAKGKSELAKSNPQLAPPADQRIEFTPPADGDYLVEVQHLNYQGGPSEAYRLTVTPSTPGFDLSLGIERYDAPPGGFLRLPLLVTRRGYAGPIDVTVVAGHPGITGRVTIPAGKPSAPIQPAGILDLHVGPDVPMGPYTFTLKAIAGMAGTPVTQYVNVRNSVSQSLANLPYPPRDLFRQLALAVTSKPPFALAARFDAPEGAPGLPTNLTITAVREPGFDEEITLTPPPDLPPGVKPPAFKPIPKGQSEVTVPLVLDSNTALGQFTIRVGGKAKFQNREYLVSAPPVPLVVTRPFELEVEPRSLTLNPGGKATLTIRAVRKGGYRGPITVEVKNLPAEVTAEKGTIPTGQAAVDLQVTAAASAAAAGKADVSAVGTATAAGNQQNTSPNFAVNLAAPPKDADAVPPHAPPVQVKAAFLKLLGHPRVAPDPRLHEQTTVGDLVRESWSFASEKKADGETERVPVLILRPAGDTKKRPAVIVLHGTGGNKEGQLPFLKELVARGIIGVAIDARYHGARAGGARGAAAYNAAITRAWRTKPGEPMEHPLYYDTCWDLWRTVDFLQTHEAIDPARIGMIGFSMGGIETWLAAAVDERVKVAVPAIAVQSFRWSLDHDQWQGRARTIRAAHEAAAKDLGEPAVNQRVCRALWSKVLPGILDEFDGPSMLRLFAPRPLLILNGAEDPNCPLTGARLAFAAAEKAYQAAGASDQLRIMVAEGVGHRATPEQRQAALAWFERWLK